MRKHISIFVLVIVILCGLIYWRQSGSLSPEKNALETSSQRIVSLSPATTEILFALGLDDEIVGVTTFCDYPLRAKSKDKIGSFSRPSIEKIMSLKPDLIVATGLEQAATVAKLKQLGLNVFVCYPATLSELWTAMAGLGELTHTRAAAHAVISQMTARIALIQEKIKHIPQEQRPKVFVEISHNPLMTAGKGSYIDELLTLAGGRNIAQDTPRPYSYFNVEQVVVRNPDCIILAYMADKNAPNTFRHRLGWEMISAVKNKRVYNDIDPALFLRPGPRLVEGLESIYKRLYSS